MLSNVFDSYKNTSGSRKDVLDEGTVTISGIANMSNADWRPGDIILDRYKIEQIYSGAMGRVFIAEHLGWKVKMAIKAPKPEVLADQEGIKRVITEANSWVRMGMHPNIATCYYVLNIDETPYLFIEYVDGGDLSSWIKTGRCRDLRTLLAMAIQFCHGMEFTHSKGIIHRDIKPGNILLTKNALLKVTDFGIIQTTRSDDKRSALTPGVSEETVGFRGTPSYASPEQFKDTHTVDKRSDIFSFGICLWLMFCGRRPYKNNAVRAAAQPTPAAPDAVFEPGLVQILKKCVEHDPDDRYQSFEELRYALNDSHLASFNAPCPYMDLDFSDLQAENLNNRAISFLELNKKEEGEICLQRALDLNDALPEGVFNFNLLKWKKGGEPARLYRQLEASRQRMPDAKMLETLAQSIRCELHKDTWALSEDELIASGSPPSPPAKTYYPEYLLCLPKNSLSIFQRSQLIKSAKADITDLLNKKRYQLCYKKLFQIWEGNDFKKDPTYLKVYERLLTVGKKKKIISIIRLNTLRNYQNAAVKLLSIPDSKKIFSIAKDGNLMLYNYGKPNQINILEQYKHVNTACLSTDGTLVAIGRQNGRIDLLSFKTGKIVSKATIDSPVSSLAINNSNKFLITGGLNGKLTLHHIASGKVRELARSEKSRNTALCTFMQGDDFISGNENGTIEFWRPNDPAPSKVIKAHQQAVLTLAPADNGLTFISASNDLTVKIWDRQTGKCLKSIDVEEDSIASALPLLDGKYVITAGEDDIIKLWGETDKPILLRDGRGDGITAISQGPRPHIFLAAGRDGSIIIWIIVYELEFD